MTYSDLWLQVDRAKELHKMTRDPLLLGAVQVLMGAVARAADLDSDDDYELQPMESVASRCVDRMYTAKLTLFG